ncbi:uncharacterized protein LOC131264481 [Anopheles coustani]|uniref:uncharacterized protein LOC131264481 n=1 Tax=Anopheles coustani TaxID=139045 RepID=UPI00265987F0|nr:uncharacterized protein LOC131264481 [Anopheles coustani]
MDFVTDDEKSSDEENAMDDEENSADDEEDGPDYANMPDAECVRYWALTGNESLAIVGQMFEMLRAKTDMNIPKDPRIVLRKKRIIDLPEESIELEFKDIKCKLVKTIGEEEGEMIFFTSYSCRINANL